MNEQQLRHENGRLVVGEEAVELWKECFSGVGGDNSMQLCHAESLVKKLK